MKSPAATKYSMKSGPSWPLHHPGLDRIAAAPSTRNERFLFGHFWLPLLTFAVLAIGLMLLHGDAWVADRLYAWQGHRWALRDAFVTQGLIHIAGRDLSTAAWLAVAATWVVARLRPGGEALRTPRAYLARATQQTTALGAGSKAWSNLASAGDGRREGGDRP